MEWSKNILDTHFHLWELNRFHYDWPTPELSICKDHVPNDLFEEVNVSPIKDLVFVQCLNHSLEETRWVSTLAKTYPRIKGIVAGLDPSHKKFEKDLMALKMNVPELVGIRHIPDLDTRQDFFLIEDVTHGMALLEKNNLTFDLLLRPPLIEQAATLAGRCPGVKMVCDHLGKPYIKDKQMDPWRQHISALARNPNVYCKLSGMVTEADLEDWKPDDLRPYVEHVLSVFGVDRVMFGSDWPVCHLANSNYKKVFDTLLSLLDHLPDQQLEKIFSLNGRTFYNIKDHEG